MKIEKRRDRGEQIEQTEQKKKKTGVCGDIAKMILTALLTVFTYRMESDKAKRYNCLMCLAPLVKASK